jgi:selenocysteine-specific elongation factor
MRVVATAGHVDHGKSSLVLALTGMDPDRFAEEKRRGLTIDLGFAWTELPSGETIAFVDVPGHVAFIKNMLAGVGAVEACLFVVDAAEGWKPQSEEHLRILEMLGVSHGVVALTKADLVDADALELARLDVADHLAQTFLATAAVVAVSAATGESLGELRHALDRLVVETPPPTDRGRPRLWVDRVFAAKGAGTVVTGTLLDGSLAVGDHVTVGPRPRRARIRAIETLGTAVDRVGPGSRVALNLSGVEHRSVVRGDAVVQPDRWHVTARADASLHVLASLDHDVGRRGAYVVYIGSGAFPATVRVLGPPDCTTPPGADGVVRLHLATPLPLLPGDRYVLRESGRAETVGGGEVLDVAPVLPASRARPDRSVARVVTERGWVDADELERLTGERLEPTIGRWVTAPGVVEALTSDLTERVASAGPLGLDVSTLNGRERAASALIADLVMVGDRARLASTTDALAAHPFLGVLEAGGVSPPDPAGVDRAELRALVQRHLAIEVDGLYFAPSALETAAAAARELLRADPAGFTLSRFRERLGTTRKYAVPLASALDARGITRRRGDLRIAGPRLDAAGSPES